MSRLRVLYHDKCFDGVSSAAVFSKLYRQCIDPGVEIEYEGLTHKAGQQIGEDIFGAGENVIVDFKYSASPRLTWWFDHHESAFLSAADEMHFREDRSGRKFHDPAFRSCTKFIASIMASRFGAETDSLADLIRWADIIDGAQFSDARTAVELPEPAMKLMLVVEAAHDSRLLHGLIRDLQVNSLAEIVESPEIRPVFDRLYSKHIASIDTLRSASEFSSGVIHFDVSEHGLDGYNKFIPYYLFPEAVYTVGVSLSSIRAKVSVGTNPWSPRERRHNLARLCEKYGGGGHAVVAAISFRPDELQNARAAADEIADTLRRDLDAS